MSPPLADEIPRGFATLLPVLLLIVWACVLALGRMGPAPEPPLLSEMSVLIDITPKVCEASWYAILLETQKHPCIFTVDKGLLTTLLDDMVQAQTHQLRTDNGRQKTRIKH